MFFNNFIQVFLYIPFVVIFLVFLLASPKTKIKKQLKFNLGVSLFLIFLGSIIAILKGLYVDNEGVEIVTDFKRILAFSLLIIFPLFFSFISKRVASLLNNIYIHFAFIYALLVTLSLLFAGMGNSIFPGYLFRASTVNLSLLSAWAFFGLYGYVQNKKNVSLMLCLISWFACLLSLAKWNLFVDLMIPFLFVYTLVYKNKRFSADIKIATSVFIVFAVFAVVVNSGPIFNKMAVHAGYDDMTHFVNSRVIRDESKNTHIDKGVIPLAGDKGIKDGGRTLVWMDLITRTTKSPLTGVGFGSRGLDWIGFNMEDHNIFVTFFSRFGIPVFLLLSIFLWKSFRTISKITLNLNETKVHAIFNFSVMNFIFQASVGNVWGQLVIAYFIGTSWGIMMRGKWN